jgi:hypothetical protein
MSADSRTRQYPTPSPPARRSGFNPLTLAIAALSSVAAALVVSKIWSGGTIMATAMTPVIVAVVKEALERPASKIDVGVSRLSTIRQHDPDALVVEEFEPGQPDEPSEMSVYSSSGGRKWKVAVITGLLAFVVAVAVLTLPELVSGRSIVSGGKRTTLFQGHRNRNTSTTQSTQTQTVTQTTPTATVTQTVPSTQTTPPTVTQTTPAQPAPQQSTTPTTPSGGATTPTTTTPAP